MIHTEKETGVPKHLPLEGCCFCGDKTNMWHRPKDVPVCNPCSVMHEPEEVPDKRKWCKSEQAKRHVAKNFFDDLI